MTLPGLPLSPAAELAALHLGPSAAETPPSAETVATLPCPDEQQIRAQLARILGSEAFDASLRNRAFLRYVVDQTLAGHADYIKGYSVAQEVFRRDVNFDPQLDPVVRIEARRLRRSLELYYLTAGRYDFVRIELPKGGYVPTFGFTRFDQRQPLPEDPFREPRRPGLALVPGLCTIIVRGFESVGDRRQDCSARGLTDELVGRLLPYAGIAVVAEGAGAPFRLAAGGPGADGSPPAAILLTGSLQASARRVRTWVQLLDAVSGRYLWVKAYDLACGSEDMCTLQEKIATVIAETIAGPSGALAEFQSRS